MRNPFRFNDLDANPPVRVYLHRSFPFIPKPFSVVYTCFCENLLFFEMILCFEPLKNVLDKLNQPEMPTSKKVVLSLLINHLITVDW
jgi:hypothetical protein